MIKIKDEKKYQSPAIKVVEFKVESGFEVSRTINQAGTEAAGMNEQMNYDSGNSLNYDWTTGY